VFDALELFYFVKRLKEEGRTWDEIKTEIQKRF